MSKLDNDNIEERVRQYLKKEYKIVVELRSREYGGGWFAHYVDFPGVMGDGGSREEAIVDVRKAFVRALRCAILAGDVIPEPSRS